MRESSTSLVKSSEKNFFINYSVVQGPHIVIIIGGWTLLVQGVGNVQLEHVDALKGLLRMKGLRLYLLSLQQLV